MNLGKPSQESLWNSVNRLILRAGESTQYQLETTGGPTSYTSGSELAARGLSLDSTKGLMTGIPNELGDFNCTITAMNSSGADTKSFFCRVLKGTKEINWDQNLMGLTYGDAAVELSASATMGAGS